MPRNTDAEEAGAAGLLIGSTATGSVSPQPSSNNATSAWIAASASSPAALTCTLSPWEVCSAMIATSDLAFALKVCLCRKMLELNPFAAWANTAAGRACKPLALGRVTGLENSALPSSSSTSAFICPGETCNSGWPDSTSA